MLLMTIELVTSYYGLVTRHELIASGTTRCIVDRLKDIEGVVARTRIIEVLSPDLIMIETVFELGTYDTPSRDPSPKRLVSRCYINKENLVVLPRFGIKKAIVWKP